MGMKPVPMEKIRVIATKDRAPEILSILHDMKVIQLD